MCLDKDETMKDTTKIKVEHLVFVVKDVCASWKNWTAFKTLWKLSKWNYFDETLTDSINKIGILFSSILVKVCSKSRVHSSLIIHY